MAKVVVSFSLDNQKDKRILRHLNDLPKGERSQAIREALYLHIGGGGITLADVYQAITDLDRRLGAGVMSAQNTGSGVRQPALEDEPDDVAANLDGLGL